MPKTLNPDVLARVIVGSSMTSMLRTLKQDIAQAVETRTPLDWSEDLTLLGIEVNEKNIGSLRTAFGTVASEAMGAKHAARVKVLDSGEVAVAFRTVQQRKDK